MSRTLVIGNKAYSSWSLRPWIAMKQIGLTFDEIVISMAQPGTKAEMLAHAPTGKVPVLKDGDVAVWETLAILEYLNETYANDTLWPKDKAARAHARAIASEMHAGFGALRSHCPMNVRRRPEPYALTPDVMQDVARIEAMWTEARQRYGQGGPFLFGVFSAADAMFAPVVNRLHDYVIPVSPVIRAYIDAVRALPAMQEWNAAAAKEPWVIADSERY